MNYKHFLNHHFDSCPCIAETEDLCRQRRVRIFALPGHFDHVGVSDGTDAWIAPINAINPFWVDVRRLMEKLRAGEPLHTLKRVRTRLRAAVEHPPPPPPPPTRQRVVLVEEKPRSRTRVTFS